MPTFNYKAVDITGKMVRGRMTAANDIDLEERLKGIGLDILNSRELKGKVYNILNAISSKDKIMLCVHLQQLDKAGVPILDALADVRDSTESPRLKDLIADIYESVKAGAMLSEALAKHPETFDSVFIGLVAAGEKTGNLHESFGNLAHHLKWGGEIKRKIKKAMYMPIFTVIVLCGSIGVLMVKVVPQLTQFLKSQGQEMPVHTRALIATSDFMENYWLVVLLIPIFLVFLIKTLKRTTPGFAYGWDKTMLYMPVIGKPLRKIDLARFTHFFSILYNSGIDILDCLKVGQQVVKNRVLLDSVVKVRKIVSEGNSLTGALRSTNQFPSLVVRMFKVGEDTGNMKEALENINFFYDKEVDDAVDGIVGSIKPALTIVAGTVLAWMAAAVFGPIYDTIGKASF
jgi:type IV pilus assembly protein PilC